jgi:alkanesulfonate monooxygenase SsuD/methylene tetrahydromethanopterin reductase-like flavin-dependent oxidoreductase (luciferase family)
VCVAVEGRFLQEPSVDDLRAAAVQAEVDGMEAVFVADGPLGDATVLAGALSEWTSGIWIGVRATLGPAPHRHPAVLAREMTTLDLLNHGRSLLAFGPPFDDATTEAVLLCRSMWRDGTAQSVGPHYPVGGAVNRPSPRQPEGPAIALDLSVGAQAPPELLTLTDYVILPSTGTSDDVTFQPA